jgi:hypothetical protein
MTPEARSLIRTVLDAPEHAAEISLASVPAALGALAELQGLLTLRLVSGREGQGATAKPPTEPDRLLTPEEAAEIMGVSPRWLRRRAKALPFARRLSRKALRFSETGLRRYLAARRP